jgi:hypothetical protein
MHAIFLLYGKRESVELLLRDMAAQKYSWALTKGKKEKTLGIEGQVRLLPFGIYEHIFPREAMDLVLTTLNFHKPKAYEQHKGLKWALIFKLLRKILRMDKIPKFKTDRAYWWTKNDVSIIPLGVRYDGDLTEEQGKYKGWKHESI